MMNINTWWYLWFSFFELTNKETFLYVIIPVFCVILWVIVNKIFKIKFWNWLIKIMRHSLLIMVKIVNIIIPFKIIRKSNRNVHYVEILQDLDLNGKDIMKHWVWYYIKGHIYKVNKEHKDLLLKHKYAKSVDKNNLILVRTKYLDELMAGSIYIFKMPCNRFNDWYLWINSVESYYIYKREYEQYKDKLRIELDSDL